MKPRIWMAAAFASSLSITAAAQSTTGTGRTNTTATASAITVTGCVQNISSADESGTTARGYLLAMDGDGRGGTTPTAMATPGSTEGATAGRQGTAPPTGTVTGTSGTANTAAASAGAESTGTAGSPAATPAPTAHPSARLNNSYVLTGDDSELKDQVGHKVEVTGTVESSVAGTRTADNSPSPSTLADSPKLHVLSVKKISSACSGK